MTLTNKERQQLNKHLQYWSIVDESYGCWLWHRSGQRKYETRIHRLAYAIWNEDFDDRLNVLHTCDTPRCVNPNHLFLGTQTDNIKDRDKKGRQAKGEKTRLFKKGYLISGQKNPNFGHFGECSPHHKLTELDVKEILHLQKESWTQKAIAKEFGVNPSLISLIVSRKSWKHL
jgi:HNH endonuclease